VSILKSWKKPNDLLPKLTKPAMVIISALLVSSLATCNASPSYAEVDLESNTELSLIKIQAIASHYQPLNNDSFILVDMVAVRVNNDLLSKSTSVTPQRHCGFFAPVICLASQARYKYGVSAAASPLRLQSVYDGMTRPNKPMANKSGGSSRPRVNPVTLISQISVIQNSKLLGVVNHD
jgi:hypothetical protein